MSGTFGLQWHITNRCDQRCKHCYIFNSGKAVATSDFPIAMVDDTLDKFMTFCTTYQKRPALAITGGDPLLHPEFWQLIQKVYARDISFSILGNPFHITVEIMQRLRDYGCRAYQMSLDGLEQTHDMFRRPGSYQATISKVRELVNAGFTINIMSTVSAKNYREIPDLARIVNGLGVKRLCFRKILPYAS